MPATFTALPEIFPVSVGWPRAEGLSAIRIVKDINPAIDPSPSSTPGALVAWNSKVLFSANQERTGIELWSSDGTAEGTLLVKDILPDNAGTPGSNPVGLTAAAGVVYFSTRSADFNGQLWKTDGTPNGTVLLAEFATGSGQAAWLAPVGGAMFFVAGDPAHGRELWRSDGTPAGTSMVADLRPGTAGSSSHPFGTLGSVMLFTADDGTHGDELWVTDGTAAGTAMVMDINPTGASHPGRTAARVTSGWNGQMAERGGVAWFLASDGVHGEELWVTDGTAAGTHLAADINPAAGQGSSPEHMTWFHDTLYFAANDGVHGAELWSWPAADAAPALLADLNVGSASSAPGHFTVLGDALYFTADDGVHGIELWKTDGTASGTSLVLDIQPGATTSMPIGSNWDTGYQPFPVMGGAFYFFAEDGVHGREVWRSDGTSAGTALLKDVVPPGGSSSQLLVVSGARVYFDADDGVHGRELWASDGTTQGTALVKDIAATDGSDVQNVMRVGANVFFTARLPGSANALWSSDGTEVGTVALQVSPPTLAAPTPFRSFGSTLLFGGQDGVNGYELWQSDGSPLGTQLLADIYPGINSGIASYSGIEQVNGYEIFAGNDGVHDIELWRTDGTAAGTQLVRDINPQTSTCVLRYSMPANFTPLGGTVVFSADDGTHGVELWRTDGTDVGTQMIADINPVGSAFVSRGGYLKPALGALYLRANDGSHGYELWKTDGTEAGTALVKDINVGPGDGPIDIGFESAVAAGYLYFSANDGIHGVELWRTDGTEAGTSLVFDTNPGPGDGQPAALTALGDRVVFVASDGVHGRELWVTDVAGTDAVLVMDVRAGPLSSAPSYVQTFGEKTYFTADDGVHGAELWTTDGTAAGTRLLADVNPGPGTSSALGSLVEVNGTVFFAAYDGLERSLWSTQGTPSSTHRVCDRANHFAVLGTTLTAAAGKIYFAADSNRNALGRELYQLDPSVPLPTTCP